VLAKTLKYSDDECKVDNNNNHNKRSDDIHRDIEEQLWKKIDSKSSNMNIQSLGHSKHFKKWRKFDTSHLMERRNYPVRNKLQPLIVSLSTSLIEDSGVGAGKGFNNMGSIESPKELLESISVTSVYTQIRLKTVLSDNRASDIFLAHPHAITLLEWFDIIKYHTVDISINTNSVL
jgi:hypothetical protein